MSSIIGKGDRFTLIESDKFSAGYTGLRNQPITVDILVDRQTCVQYLCYKGCALTPLIGPDGKPLLWENE